MSSQIAFFLCEVNDIFHARQGNCLLSSPSNIESRNGIGDIKGRGRYLYKQDIENNRRLLTLFSIRSLPKHTWFNSNDVFIGRVE